MALERLTDDLVYRWYIASPLAFADWTQPTVAELNANPTNDPNGLIFNITCAVNTDGSQFDLDDPEVDESLTFCQKAGDTETISRSATVVWNMPMAKNRWLDGTSVAAVDGFNTANLALSLLAWRGVDYFAILSVGKADDAPFTVNDRIKMAEVSTDLIVPEGSSGSKLTLTQTPAKRTNLLWNYKVAA